MNWLSLALSIMAVALSVWCLVAIRRAVEHVGALVVEMQAVLADRDRHALQRFIDQLTEEVGDD